MTVGEASAVLLIASLLIASYSKQLSAKSFNFSFGQRHFKFRQVRQVFVQIQDVVNFKQCHRL